MHKDTPLLRSEFSIEFSTSPSWFRTIRQLICTASTQCGFDDRTAGQIAMAVDEALCNIHRHGYKGEYGKAKLHVTTHTSPSPKIVVSIHDEADQVDTSHIKSRNLDEVRPGGLGVHLIQTIMDDATWTKRECCGMILTMSKTSITNAKQQPLTNSNND